MLSYFSLTSKSPFANISFPSWLHKVQIGSLNAQDKIPDASYDQDCELSLSSQSEYFGSLSAVKWILEKTSEMPEDEVVCLMTEKEALLQSFTTSTSQLVEFMAGRGNFNKHVKINLASSSPEDLFNMLLQDPGDFTWNDLVTSREESLFPILKTRDWWAMMQDVEVLDRCTEKLAQANRLEIEAWRSMLEETCPSCLSFSFAMKLKDFREAFTWILETLEDIHGEYDINKTRIKRAELYNAGLVPMNSYDVYEQLAKHLLWTWAKARKKVLLEKWTAEFI